MLLTQMMIKLTSKLQFAFRQYRGIEDANLKLLNYLFNHLEKPKTHARLLFIDFSSAFNTMKPHLLVEKLISLFNLDLNICGWILDFLVGRQQCVRVTALFLTSSFVPLGPLKVAASHLFCSSCILMIVVAFTGIVISLNMQMIL